MPKLPRPSLPKRRRPPTPQESQYAVRKPDRKAPKPDRKVPKPSRKRPPLAIILGVVVVIVALFFLVRACGSDDEAEVRKTVERFGQAARDKDYQALCDDLLAIALVNQARSAGQPCEVAMRISLGERKEPKVEIDSVKVDGDKARVKTHSTAVGEQPSQDTVGLIKEDGDWRISSLEGEAPPDPTP